MTAFFNWFVKLTSWIAQRIVFRIKVYYEDDTASRKIRGKAIVISNHCSVYDFAAMMFVFFQRTLRCVMSEILFRKNIIFTLFLKAIGGIRADRESYDFSFVARCKKILSRGGVVEIYPEGRLPRPGEERPLPFKPSTVYLALESGAPIIPVYTNGKYFCKERTRVIVGKPICVESLYDATLSEKENIANINAHLRKKIIELGNELNRQENAEKEKKI